jgi:hypothetical protein
MDTCSPFTRWVSNYRLSEKFKVPQVISYVGNRDPLDHLENVRAHLDLQGTPDEVACRAFPLLLFWGMPGTSLGSCPRNL